MEKLSYETLQEYSSQSIVTLNSVWAVKIVWLPPT